MVAALKAFIHADFKAPIKIIKINKGNNKEKVSSKLD